MTESNPCAGDSKPILHPLWALLALFAAGCIWGHTSGIAEALEPGRGIVPPGWNSSGQAMALFMATQAVFFCIVFAGMRPTLYRSSVLAGAGISLSLSPIAWSVFFMTSEHLLWWHRIPVSQIGGALCLIGLALFIFARWLRLPDPVVGEAPFLAGFLVAAIPVVIIGPLVALFLTHHPWLAWLRSASLVSSGLLIPMVGTSLGSFVLLEFFFLLGPVVLGLLAHIRWRNAEEGEAIGSSPYAGLCQRSSFFYATCLLVLYLVKIAGLAAISEAVASVRSASLFYGIIFPMPLSMVMFLLITPFFLTEWMLLFALNESLQDESHRLTIRLNEKLLVIALGGLCFGQTAAIFALGLEHGMGEFYMVSLTLVFLMGCSAFYRARRLTPIPDFSLKAFVAEYWESFLCAAFIAAWFNCMLIHLGLGIGLDFIPLIRDLSDRSFVGLLESLSTIALPAFPPLILFGILWHCLGLGVILPLVMALGVRITTASMQRAVERELAKETTA